MFRATQGQESGEGRRSRALRAFCRAVLVVAVAAAVVTTGAVASVAADDGAADGTSTAGELRRPTDETTVAGAPQRLPGEPTGVDAPQRLSGEPTGVDAPQRLSGEPTGVDAPQRGDVTFVNCTTMRVSADVEEVAVTYWEAEVEYDATMWVRPDGATTVRVPFLELPSVFAASYRASVDGPAEDPIVAGGTAPWNRERCAEGAWRAVDPDLTFYGDTRTASLSGYDRNDTLSFWGARGDVVTIDLRSADAVVQNVDATGVEDPRLLLRGPGGTVLVRDDDGGRGNDSRIARYELPRSGAYTVVVTADGSLPSGTTAAYYDFSLTHVRGPTTARTDADDIPDGQERYFGTDPADPDTDGDGYWDGDEVRHGYDPTDPTDFPYRDTDGDGYTDDREVAAGTDPTDPHDHP
ncbi:MAG: hypothetical protein ABEJ22_05010 [Haloferacaceae archaeon]